MIKVDQSKFENLIAKYSQAIFKTNQGSFTIKFYGDKAPETVNNFMNLAKLGYYDGVKFHRVIANFMIQGGDQNTKDDSLMNSWGMGGPGYTIKDEFGVGLSNIPGTISMANAGPGTGGSQFFINVNNNSYLDGKHAVFGEVSEGAEVVAAISKSSVDSSDRPTSPVVIESITLK
ncbi:MAG: peptidylprolyl isomerase [Patescibacteria group bacterium]